MEYYAKSPAKILTSQEEDKLVGNLKNILDKIGENFEDWEINAIRSNIESVKADRENRQKTLREHLNDAVECAEDFFSIYGDYFTDKEKCLIVSACKYHDIGKANLMFQSIVQPQISTDLTVSECLKNQIPHGYLSAFSLSEKSFCNENPQCDKYDFAVLLTSIYYHHDREDSCGYEAIKTYCDKYYTSCVREFTGDSELVLKYKNENKLLFSKKHARMPVSEDVWCRYMIVKGMLNKFDWNVSAEHEKAEFESDIKKHRLCGNIEEKISASLKPAQKFMQDNCDKNVVIIAPTGSGKTEAAFLWLNGEKGFYTLPLKVSSNAIYERIKFKYNYNDVALLHSDSMSGYIKETDGNIKSGYLNYERANLLSYPLTVCTVDQIFKFVYKALGTEIFAATLKYSKVIIDEIQSYDARVTAALIYALSEIKIMGSRFAIITATFPPVLKYFMKKCGLLEERDYVFRDFSKESLEKRHKVRIESGRINISDIISEASDKKVLVICNTVARAQEIYTEILDYIDESGIDTEVNLLHSKFIRRHRNFLEKDIMDFSKDENACGIWVTTQIVEASLDIDFDILYTEMCTIDSLIQRMGRCNRACKKTVPDDGNIIVYEDGSGIGTVYEEEIVKRSLDVLQKYTDRILSESDKTDIINEVYDIDYIKQTKYFKNIITHLNDLREIDPLDYDYKKTSKEFRKINSVTVMPDSIYEENRYLVENIVDFLGGRNIDRAVRRILKNKLSEFTVDISNFSRTGSIPQNVDISTIGNTDIHRTSLKYDFDECRRKGRGLVMGEAEQDDYII